jgi:DNA ligase (NAD+)
MDIEGVGPAIIEQLVDTGLVHDAADLYGLTKDMLLRLEGVKERSSENILGAIDASRGRDFDRVLFALGIRHVGRTTAGSLVDAFGSMERMTSASVEELSNVDGVGKVVAVAIRQFLDNPRNAEFVGRLAAAGLHMASEGGTRDGPLAGKVFLFTGELGSMSRSEAGEAVEALGGKVGASVTKATDYVVVGENPGSKAEKAKKAGKTILDEAAFLALVGR